MSTPVKILISLGIICLALWVPPSTKNFDEISPLEGLTNRPQSVNVTKLLLDISSLYESTVRVYGHTKAGFPFLDSQQYLSTLSTYASLTRVNRALVVTGSRGSGKSEGILKMIPAWIKLNHIVLNYDYDHIGTVENALAKQIADVFLKVNSTVLECYHTNMIPECGVRASLRLKAGDYSISIPFKQGDPKWILLLIAAIVIASAPFKSVLLTAVWGFLHPTLKWIIIGIAVIMVILLVLYFMLSYWVWIDALEELIADHTLRALICICNVISKCIPDQQPILIIRHYLTNVNATNSLFKMLRDGIGQFPIIVEASDFRWEGTPSVIKSREVFINFHLGHMTYEEGKAQLVHKHKIWSMPEYDAVYGAVGGHMASLRLLFDYHKVLNMTLNQAIAKMTESAYSRVVDALSKMMNPEVILLILSKLETEGVFEMVHLGSKASLWEDIETLSDMNILFITAPGGKLYPQTDIIRWGMKEVVKFFREK